MGSHPLNLALRFLLEFSALILVGFWGWQQHSGMLQYILLVTLPELFAVIWGVFNVPNDPSRSGKAPVKIPGWLRLLIELILFGFAVWTLFDMHHSLTAYVFGGIVLIHYLISYDRIYWLLFKASE